ncbi:sensor histidine kinase [Paenibacillus hodogayensis]|uniref:histidine kinase n=1 Tax=Paenibacillus hodogayensis TaxID=279208 RepID=A0ABV5W333_9BACL
MDTKSKNNRKVIWVRFLLVGLVGLALQLSVGLYPDRDYIYGNPFLYKDDGPFWNIQVERNVSDIATYYWKFNNAEPLDAGEPIGEELLRQWKEDFDYLTGEMTGQAGQALEAQTIPFTEWTTATPSLSASLLALQEKTGKWMSEEWNKEVPEAWQTYVQERSKQYFAEKANEKEALKRTVDRLEPVVKYTIKDNRRNMTFSNRESGPEGSRLPPDTDTVRTISFPIKDRALLEKWGPNSPMSELSAFFNQNQLEGSFTFHANAEPTESVSSMDFIISKDYTRLLAIRKQLPYEIAGLSAAVLGIVLLLGYEWTQRGAADRQYGRIIARWQRIPVDLRAALFAAVLITAFGYGRTIYGWGMHYPLFRPVFRWALFSLLGAYAGISVWDGLRLYRTKGALAEQWRSSYTLYVCGLIKETFVRKTILLKAGLLFMSTVLVGLALLAVAADLQGFRLLSIFYIASYLLIGIPYFLRKAAALNVLLAGLDEMAAGRLNLTFAERGNGTLSHMFRQLNNMKQGMQTALDKQLKSEKLKTELISNVSHDLKTPLTSMINYVDLLKQEDGVRTGESVRYIQVLEGKTKRLKALIDDLFEASQLASGTVVPVMETVDVAALLQQTLAECGDKIAESGLQFRVQVQHPHLYARLDGKKTWRVFENLIRNALSYSLPNTRVHLALTEQEDSVIFRIHNISAYEIDFDPEELFERSKRGDASRHTEGSGLGLTIAKSIVELQGGSMHIGIEGDLFKVSVHFLKGDGPGTEG